MIKGKNILVTGATGFIGSNVVRKLLELRANVHILSRQNSNFWRLQDILPDIRNHPLTTNKEEFRKIIFNINPQIIFHFAAYGNSSSQKDITEMIRVNIESLNNLLEAVNNINYEAFINTGSSSEYGFKTKPMTESDILEPNSFYSATKSSGTYLCQVYANLFHKPITTIRPFSVYGYFEERNRLVPTAILSCLSKKEINITNNAAFHDFIFIDDVIDAYIKAAEKKLSGEIINIGSGKEVANEEIVNLIVKLTNQVKINKNKFPKRQWDSAHWQANISKAKKLLGWQPQYSLEEGLKKTIKWFKSNNDKYRA